MSELEIGKLWQGKNNEGDVVIVWANLNRVHYDYLKSNGEPMNDAYDTAISNFLEYFEPKPIVPYASFDFSSVPDKTVTCDFYSVEDDKNVAIDGLIAALDYYEGLNDN